MFKEWLACVAEYEMQLQAMLEIIEDMEDLYNTLNTMDNMPELTAKEQRDSLHAMADMLYLHEQVSEKLRKLDLV